MITVNNNNKDSDEGEPTQQKLVYIQDQTENVKADWWDSTFF